MSTRINCLRHCAAPCRIGSAPLRACAPAASCGSSRARPTHSSSSRSSTTTSSWSALPAIAQSRPQRRCCTSRTDSIEKLSRPMPCPAVQPGSARELSLHTTARIAPARVHVVALADEPGRALWLDRAKTESATPAILAVHRIPSTPPAGALYPHSLAWGHPHRTACCTTVVHSS